MIKYEKGKGRDRRKCRVEREEIKNNDKVQTDEGRRRRGGLQVEMQVAQRKKLNGND